MTRTIQLLFAAALLAAASAAQADDHKDYKDARPEECRECHRSSGVADNHGADFLRSHRLLAQKTTPNCSACHQQSFCVDCHNGGNVDRDPRSALSRRGEIMPRTHTPDFVATHPIIAREEPRSCTSCHQQATFCSDCHQKVMQQPGGIGVKPHAPTYVAQGQLDPSWTARHAKEAKRNLTSCQSCHPRKADCSNTACHPGLRGE